MTKPGDVRGRGAARLRQGQGGSEVEVSVGGQTLTFTVEDTGGFQTFKARDIGTRDASTRPAGTR